ncbi:MAG: acyltransferase domain-containing protein [Blautia producta]
MFHHHVKMKDNIAFLFAGQGSQYYGMGYDLYQENHVFREVMDEIDSKIYSITAYSVVAELYNPRNKGLIMDDILYSHPAIFMIEIALAKVLLEAGVKPQYVLGASLGELVAFVVAGRVSLDDMIKVVMKQALTMKQVCKQINGMMTVLADYRKFDWIRNFYPNIELCGINYNEQFVIAGCKSDLANIKDLLSSQNILSYILPINYGFHSTLIEEIKPYIEDIILNIETGNGIEIISCTNGKDISSFRPEFLWDIIRKRIHFPEAFNTLRAKKVCNIIDLSPAGTLANFINRILDDGDKNIVATSIITPFKKENKQLEKVCKNLGIIPQEK